MMNKCRILTSLIWRNQDKLFSCRNLPLYNILNKRELHFTDKVYELPRDYSDLDLDNVKKFGSLTIFDEIADKQDKIDKKDFRKAVEIFLKKDSLYRRGSVEFINVALDQMEKYNAHRDLMSYKVLLTVFPKDKMVPLSSWQSEMMHYPKHQQCGIDIMEKMERNGIIPDQQFGDMLYDRFGDSSHVFRKYQRMTYWLPKFKNANPYRLPDTYPDCRIELAKLALNRMCIDYHNKITVWETRDIEEEVTEDTFIASAMSPDQQKLISNHPISKPLFVEGYFTTWMRHISQPYFILRADPEPAKFQKKKAADRELFEWDTIFEEENSSMAADEMGIHEQEDGTILGMCITGTASKNSVMTWVKYLQENNPNLSKIPIVFSIRSPTEDSQLETTTLPKRKGITKRIQ